MGFSDKAKDLQKRAKETMNDKEKRDEMMRRGKEQGKKTMDRAKQKRDESRRGDDDTSH
ncbi:hypothetical protein [Streptomyces sp. RFCAC02]|uniref:hypothetical protein n=1 Tax=Streptomyces sp. RFCAC02 TaxID=2499143 RepID=UPI00143D721E|nr:hypothetical protein [Streptomyces sp. RFCAC02]